MSKKTTLSHFRNPIKSVGKQQDEEHNVVPETSDSTASPARKQKFHPFRPGWKEKFPRLRYETVSGDKKNSSHSVKVQDEEMFH